MIRRPSDLWPKPLLDEYRRLIKLPRLPIEIEISPGDSNTAFQCKPIGESYAFKFCETGGDFAGMLANICWIKEGPKIVDVTEEQWQALSRVEVRLRLADFHMPFNSVLVNMPSGKLHTNVLLHRREVKANNGTTLPIMIGCSVSEGNAHDIVTVVRDREGQTVEDSLATFHQGVSDEEGEAAHAGLRVACNLMLVMTNYGCHAEYLFPKEVAEERKFFIKGNRPGREGRTASDRLAEQPMVVTLDREVELWHKGNHKHEAGEPTGREMPFHYRRGHWRKVEGKEKPIFVRPCMVRADLLLVGGEDTTTTYRG